MTHSCCLLLMLMLVMQWKKRERRHVKERKEVKETKPHTWLPSQASNHSSLYLILYPSSFPSFLPLLGLPRLGLPHQVSWSRPELRQVSSLKWKRIIHSVFQSSIHLLIISLIPLISFYFLSSRCLSCCLSLPHFPLNKTSSLFRSETLDIHESIFFDMSLLISCVKQPDERWRLNGVENNRCHWIPERYALLSFPTSFSRQLEDR